MKYLERFVRPGTSAEVAVLAVMTLFMGAACLVLAARPFAPNSPREVLVGVGSAAWLAGEELGMNKIVGGALILSASLVEAWGSAKANGKAAEAAG